MRYEADMALIRHGMTPGNEEHRYIGRTDEPLSQKGREQLLTLQKKGVYPAAACVAASPLERCRQTAELLYPGQAPCVFDQFREMDFGAFEGHNCEELKADVRYQAWIDSNGTLPFPQGEPPAGYPGRHTGSSPIRTRDRHAPPPAYGRSNGRPAADWRDDRSWRCCRRDR